MRRNKSKQMIRIFSTLIVSLIFILSSCAQGGTSNVDVTTEHNTDTNPPDQELFPKHKVYWSVSEGHDLLGLDESDRMLFSDASDSICSLTNHKISRDLFEDPAALQNIQIEVLGEQYDLTYKNSKYTGGIFPKVDYYFSSGSAILIVGIESETRQIVQLQDAISREDYYLSKLNNSDRIYSEEELRKIGEEFLNSKINCLSDYELKTVSQPRSYRLTVNNENKVLSDSLFSYVRKVNGVSLNSDFYVILSPFGEIIEYNLTSVGLIKDSDMPSEEVLSLVTKNVEEMVKKRYDGHVAEYTYDIRDISLGKCANERYLYYNVFVKVRFNDDNTPLDEKLGSLWSFYAFL